MHQSSSLTSANRSCKPILAAFTQFSANAVEHSRIGSSARNLVQTGRGKRRKIAVKLSLQEFMFPGMVVLSCPENHMERARNHGYNTQPRFVFAICTAMAVDSFCPVPKIDWNWLDQHLKEG